MAGRGHVRPTKGWQELRVSICTPRRVRHPYDVLPHENGLFARPLRHSAHYQYMRHIWIVQTQQAVEASSWFLIAFARQIRMYT